MNKQNKDTVSSSSDEDIPSEFLKEAIAEDFFQISPLNNKVIQESNDLPCRNYVAEKLQERLIKDIYLDDAYTLDHETKKTSKKHKPKGIKVFNSSNFILTEITEPKKLDKRKTSNLRKSVKIHDNTSKCKEVAIDGTRILSQCDTKYWTSRKQGKCFKYKKDKKGCLIAIQ